MRPEEILTNRLYHDLAWLVPLVSPPGDYAEEAGFRVDDRQYFLGPGRQPYTLLAGTLPSAATSPP